MKVIIWLACFFVNALITTAFRSNGILLGAIPTVLLFSATVWVARALCRKWDDHKGNKELEKQLAQQTKQPAVDSVPYEDIRTAPVSAAEWRCSCGRVNPKYQSSCVCGKSRFENMTQTKAEATVAAPQTDRFCVNCGEKLIENSRFCRKCGTAVPEN